MSIQQEIATPNARVAKKRTPTQTVTYLATLCALCVVLKWLTNVLSVAVPTSLKISLAYLGWFLSAIVAGPISGGFVAIISDLLGQLILSTGGAPNPLLLLGNFAATIVFGYIYHYLPTRKLPFVVSTIIRVILGATGAAIIGTLGLNTLGLWIYYYSSVNYLAFTLSRLIQLVMLYANASVIILLVPILKKIGVEWQPSKKKTTAESTNDNLNNE